MLGHFIRPLVVCTVILLSLANAGLAQQGDHAGQDHESHEFDIHSKANLFIIPEPEFGWKNTGDICILLFEGDPEFVELCYQWRNDDGSLSPVICRQLRFLKEDTNHGPEYCLDWEAYHRGSVDLRPEGARFFIKGHSQGVINVASS